MCLLLIFALTACGPGVATPDTGTPQRTLVIITSTPSNTRTPTITPTPIVPELADEDLAGTEIELWYLWSPAEADTLAELAGRFNAENEYDIKINAQAFSHPDDFETALEDAFAASNPPDIILAHPYQYLPWAEAGQLVELTPYLESAAYGNPTFQEDFYPVFAGRDLYDGQRWGIPSLFIGQVMLYNQTWAQELGFPNAPANAAAFQQQACAAAEANGGITGGWIIDGTQGGASAWLLAFAGELEKSGQYRFSSDEVEQGLAFLAGLKEEGCAWQPTAPYPDQAFVDRLGLFYSVSTRDIPFVYSAFTESGSTDKWIATGYPNTAGNNLMSVHGRSYVVVQSTIPQQIASWIAIQYLTSGSSQTSLAENNAYLPLTYSAAQDLVSRNALHPQWQQAVRLLDNAVVEPRLASWRVVRSIVQDAIAQVLDIRFDSGTLPLLIRQLTEMAAEYNQ